MFLLLREGAEGLGTGGLVGGRDRDTLGATFVLDLALRNFGKCILCF